MTVSLVDLVVIEARVLKQTDKGGGDVGVSRAAEFDQVRLVAHIMGKQDLVREPPSTHFHDAPDSDLGVHLDCPRMLSYCTQLRAAAA